jgi:hypothetical protein
MTDEPQVPMTDVEADYLLAAAMGLAQGARLIPARELAAHFERRFAEARSRGTDAERRALLHELGFADILQAFVAEAEQLMEARRKAAYEAVKQAKAEAVATCSTDPADLPPSRRPLADDDAWVAAPPRAPR